MLGNSACCEVLAGNEIRRKIFLSAFNFWTQILSPRSGKTVASVICGCQHYFYLISRPPRWDPLHYEAHYSLITCLDVYLAMNFLFLQLVVRPS